MFLCHSANPMGAPRTRTLTLAFLRNRQVMQPLLPLLRELEEPDEGSSDPGVVYIMGDVDESMIEEIA